MNQPRISLISAIAESNRAIGKNNQLLWDIKADMDHFRTLTTGHAIVMGEKTFHSIGKALPRRVNIVLTDNREFEAENVLVGYSIDEVLELARLHETEEVFIIGGGSIYTQFLPLASRLYLTLVAGEYEADVFFPEYSQFTKVLAEESGQEGEYRFRFVTLEKN
ncbi:MAG: dihydrofolate reductase [Patescibacteria group bacterium]